MRDAVNVYGVTKFTPTAWLQKYLRNGQVGRRRGTWRLSNAAQDAALVAKGKRNSSIGGRDRKAATDFPASAV
jgi:hypothetical protein